MLGRFLFFASVLCVAKDIPFITIICAGIVIYIVDASQGLSGHSERIRIRVVLTVHNIPCESSLITTLVIYHVGDIYC